MEPGCFADVRNDTFDFPVIEFLGIARRASSQFPASRHPGVGHSFRSSLTPSKNPFWKPYGGVARRAGPAPVATIIAPGLAVTPRGNTRKTALPRCPKDALPFLPERGSHSYRTRTVRIPTLRTVQYSTATAAFDSFWHRSAAVWLGKTATPPRSQRVTLRPMNVLVPIDFYFDPSSPYSYIASGWIEALAARYGRTVRWQAVLLGAAFRAAELKPPVAHPLKREYSLRDFECSARYAGVPLKIPATFPISTHNAARVVWWLNAEGGVRAADWARCCLRALVRLRRRCERGLGQRPLAADRALARKRAVPTACCAALPAQAHCRMPSDAAALPGLDSAQGFQPDSPVQRR